MPRKCKTVHEAHGLSQPLLTLQHSTVCYTLINNTINFSLASGDSLQIADFNPYQTIFGAVFTINEFTVEIDVFFFPCSVGLKELLVGHGASISSLYFTK